MTALTFDILGHDRSGSAAFDKVGKAADRTRGKFGALGKDSHRVTGSMVQGIGKIAGALSVVAGVAVFKSFLTEASQARKVGNITTSVIKSTGGAAKITAKQVGDLAMAISNKTGVDDELIQSSANLLLTFKLVRNEAGKGAKIFDRATQAAVDLSAVGFGSVDGAAKMLGKALNDPLKGLTALGKAGVTFTEDQKKQIATLVKTGDVLSAQKIILQEVESQVGGAAAAASEPMEKLGIILDNVKETIGTAFLPIIDKASIWLGQHLPGAAETAGKWITTKFLPPLGAVVKFVSGTLIPIVAKIVGAMKDIVMQVATTLKPVARTVIDAFRNLGGKIVTAIGKVDLGGIGKDLYKGAVAWATEIINGVKTGLDTGDWSALGRSLGQSLISVLKGSTDLIGEIGKAFGQLMDKVDWKKLGANITSWFNQMMDAVDWQSVGKHLGDLFIAMVQTGQDLTNKTTKAFTDLVDSIKWTEVGAHIATGVQGAIKGINWGDVIKSSFSLSLKTSFKGGAGGIFRTFMQGIAKGAVGIVQGLIEELVSSLFEWLKKKLPELGSAIVKALEEFSRLFTNVFTVYAMGGGEEITKGLLKGMLHGLGDLAGWLWKNVIWPIIKFVLGGFGIHSPSTVMMAIGKQVSEGLLAGILAGVSGIGNWIYSNVILPMLKPFSNSPTTWLVQRGRDVVTGLKNGAVSVAKSIGSWAYSNVILPLIRPFANSPLTWLRQKGADVIAGFKAGASSVAKGIGSWVYNNVILPVVRPFGNKPSTWLSDEGGSVIRGFLDGMQSAWKAVTDWIGGIADWIKTHKGPVSLDRTLLVPAGVAIMQGFLTGLKSGAGKAWDFVSSVGGKTKNAVAEAYGWIKDVGWPAISDLGSVPNATGMAKLVQTVAASRGWGSGDQWASLYKLIMGESGFRSNAQNPTSTAYGLFQFLDSTWGYVGAQKTSDPTRQTIAGLDYIAKKYGSPANAYSAWAGRSPHWYEKGTPWVPNDQLAFLHKGEAVIPREMNYKVRTSQGAAQTVTWRVETGGARMDDLLAELIRRYVRANGGNVQAVLGQARGV